MRIAESWFLPNRVRPAQPVSAKRGDQGRDYSVAAKKVE
ncbi:hypothetical protein CSB92_6592 [Pseudomonas aeruginosa]|nr:hypothetical protein CSC27_3330 [Pseudomonas aeruginosa]PRW14877.1 hypothetical protein CSB92_6592 [Pseudomonas aeruginosa]